MLVALLAVLLAFPGQAAQAAPGGAGESAQQAGLQALADQVLHAFQSKDLRALSACCDLQALLDTGTESVEAKPEFRRGFQTGVRGAVLPAMLKSVNDVLEAGGELRLLRIRKCGLEQALLFRLLYANAEGVEYLELFVRPQEKSQPRFGDWMCYTNGERASELLHRLYLPFAADSQRGLVDRLLGKDQLLVKHWPTVQQIVECRTQGTNDKGLELWASLPEELRHDKFLLLLRLAMAQGCSDDTQYMSALEELRRFHAGDASNEIHSIDYFSMRKQWGRCAESVRRLRQTLDGDPFLDALEAHALLEAGKPAEARKAAECAIAAEPGLMYAHWTLVSILLRQKDHAELLATLERMDGRFEIEWDDLAQSEEYADFVASPQHAQWLAYLAAKK